MNLMLTPSKGVPLEMNLMLTPSEEMLLEMKIPQAKLSHLPLPIEAESFVLAIKAKPIIVAL